MAEAAQPVFAGLKLYELLTLIGIVIGPIIAVVITLATEHLRRAYERRINVLRMMLNTRGMPSDPAYTVAINMVPVEFNRRKSVMAAWREYIEIVRFRASPENIPAHDVQMRAKQTKLIFQMMKCLGLGLSETEIQTEAYVATGLTDRDNIYLDSLRALPKLADYARRSAEASEKLVANIIPPRTV